MLTKVTQTMQKIATIQAEELSLPTKMQALYTKLMADVKLYNSSDPPSTVTDKDSDSDKVSKIGIANQESSNKIEQFRNLRDMQGEDAKKIQSTINASNDAQKGMLDLMQTMKQKQREWMASIFR